MKRGYFVAIEKGLRVLISIFDGSPPALGRNIGEILIDIRDVTRLWGQRRLVFYVDCGISLNKMFEINIQTSFSKILLRLIVKICG